MSTRISILAAVLAGFFLASIANGQSCNPAVVSLILRDAKGTPLTDADVNLIAATLPKEIGDAKVWVDQVSFAADKMTYYWPESIDWANGKKVPALEFLNSSKCTMHLTEATLEYQGLKMRLIFNIEISRSTKDRRPVIDAPNFQNGTFQLDLTNWSHAEEKLISATHWKKQEGN